MEEDGLLSYGKGIEKRAVQGSSILLARLGFGVLSLLVGGWTLLSRGGVNAFWSDAAVQIPASTQSKSLEGKLVYVQGELHDWIKVFEG